MFFAPYDVINTTERLICIARCLTQHLPVYYISYAGKCVHTCNIGFACTLEGIHAAAGQGTQTVELAVYWLKMWRTFISLSKTIRRVSSCSAGCTILLKIIEKMKCQIKAMRPRPYSVYQDHIVYIKTI